MYDEDETVSHVIVPMGRFCSHVSVFGHILSDDVALLCVDAPDGPRFT